MSKEYFNPMDYFISIGFSLLAFFVVLVTITIFMYYTRRKVIQQKVNMQREMLYSTINAQEQERARISRDLHDEVSSKITAIQLHTFLLGKESITYQERKEIVDVITKACKDLGATTRRISHDLMPPTLENFGLHRAILELIESFNKASDVNIEYDNELENDFYSIISKENEIHLFRILSELINNSIKHGNATEILMRFTKSEKHYKLLYTDNGIGISEEVLNKRSGSGLKNIYSRSNIIKATTFIDFNYKKGFCFNLILNYE